MDGRTYDEGVYFFRAETPEKFRREPDRTERSEVSASAGSVVRRKRPGTQKTKMGGSEGILGQAQGGTGLHGTGGIAKNMEDNINMKTSDNCYSNLEVGKKYYHGSGVEKNYSKAAEIFRRLAELGDADAQNYLGFMYENGQGVKQDYVKAAEWFRKAADQGYALAQYNLAIMYVFGNGVEHDDVKAAELYEKAARQGNASAQNNLALLYRYGYGVPKDPAKALELYEKAARNGCTAAQLNLGYMYEIGEETGQDYVKAAEWFRIVAEQGDPAGASNLAKLYDKGKGVPQDYAEAAKWYKIAAEHDIKCAQTRLGELYEKGLGVPQDSAKAAYWTKKGIYLRSWIYNMKTLFQRHNRYKKLNELIAKVTNPEVKDNLIKTRDEYWRRIQLLNKPNFTDEDYYQIKQEHERIDDLISKMEKLI